MSTHAFVLLSVMASAVVWELSVFKLKLPPLNILNRIALMSVWIFAYSSMVVV